MPRLAEQNIEIAPQQGPDQLEDKPELRFDPGELAPCWASPYPDAELSKEAEKELKRLCDMISNIDVAARRWEVESAWMARLFQRGYQYLWPRRGGGWIYLPFATDYNLRYNRWGSALHGNETNIYATYQEIICAAITRDIPHVRFKPDNPDSDVDITFADAASRYSRLFGQMVDLKQLHQQLAYYLATDGRALIVVDHILDAQRFGRQAPIDAPPIVPETEEAETKPSAYLIRHGETHENMEGLARGRLESHIEGRGEREIDRAAAWLKDKGIQLILSSPIERALDSANILSHILGVPIEVDDRLASLDIGGLAGEEKQDVRAEIEEAFESPEEPIDGGESANDFRKRVEAAIMDAVSRGTLVAIVTHDSVITETFHMFRAEEGTQSAIPPGGIAALTPQPDGTFDASICFPCLTAEPESGNKRGAPRGREVPHVYGKLEHKVPMNAQSMEDCLWIQISKEYDVAYVKAMFPEHAAKIRAGGSIAGENELDRIARINAVLALEASYVTGDSMVRDCTVQRNFLRPGIFMEVQSAELREELMQAFPDGAEVIQAADIFIKARNASMDDHCTLVHAFPGTGMNRLALCSKLESIQKRLNNWIELIDQFFIRCVPNRYMDTKAFDVEALKEQPGAPGDITPFSLDQVAPNRNVQDLVWMEPFPTHQPSMPQFIMLFTNEFPQLLSHALPSLFGAQDNTDTATGALIQRDQAVGCLLTPWWNIQVATASYHKQAVQLAARCRQEDILGTDKADNRIRIALSELKGSICAYPEEDANFPESWTQKQQRYQQMIADSVNPIVARFLTNLSNLRLARDMAGFGEFKIPEADCYEKQMGEFELLLAQSPLPNPAYAQAQQALQAEFQRLQAQQAMGVIIQPQEIQQLAQAQQQLQAIPQLISSVQVDEQNDNHAVEAQACQDFINDASGRRLKYGTEKQKLGLENLKLHRQEHLALIKPEGQLPKPPSVSISYKDLPPEPAAKLLTDVGLQTTGPEVVQTREYQAALKRESKISPTGE